MISVLLSALMLLPAAGCNDDNSDDSDSGDNGTSDSDTDTDTDTDTDSDTDSDSDTDTDADDIWEPGPGTTWQWQLTGTIDTSVDVEMYDVDVWRTSAKLVDELHGDGHVVICYFSAGSWEDWRPDADDFPDETIGEPLEEWPDESWIDITSEDVRQIMQTRLDMAVDLGCDGVEPDNVDGYANNNGLGLTAADQLDFNKFLAKEAHQRGLSVGLKNDLDQIDELEPWFDWALNEECFAYDECEMIHPFIQAGKAVFHVEYVDERSEGQALADDVCGDDSIQGFSTLIKTWDLDEWYIACD